MKKIVPLILLAVLAFSFFSKAQVKKQQPNLYYSTKQKIIKGVLADMSEELVYHKVIVKILLNRFEFIYPNHEREDISVTMTQAEWLEGVKEQDYVTNSNSLVKEIYFIKSENKILVDMRNGESIYYYLSIPKKIVPKKPK